MESMTPTSIEQVTADFFAEAQTAAERMQEEWASKPRFAAKWLAAFGHQRGMNRAEVQAHFGMTDRQWFAFCSSWMPDNEMGFRQMSRVTGVSETDLRHMEMLAETLRRSH